MSANIRLVPNPQPKKQAAAKPLPAPEPPSAQIVQFSTLQANHAAETAALAFTGYVDGDHGHIKRDDIVLCLKHDGSHVLAFVEKCCELNGKPAFTVYVNLPLAEIKGVIGRVVLTANVQITERG